MTLFNFVQGEVGGHDEADKHGGEEGGGAVHDDVSDAAGKFFQVPSKSYRFDRLDWNAENACLYNVAYRKDTRL